MPCCKASSIAILFTNEQYKDKQIKNYLNHLLIIINEFIFIQHEFVKYFTF